MTDFDHVIEVPRGFVRWQRRWWAGPAAASAGQKAPLWADPWDHEGTRFVYRASDEARIHADLPQVRPTVRREYHNWLIGNCPNGFRAGLRLDGGKDVLPFPFQWSATGSPVPLRAADLVPVIRFADQCEAAMFRLSWL
jgi:hypothetical protein